MPETTFAGTKVNGDWDFFQSSNAYMDAEREFLRLGRDVFEGEELIDKIYRIFLAMFATKYRGDSDKITSIADIGEAYLRGFYMPCIERIVLSGQIDLLNDRIPDYAGLVLVSGDKPDFISARKAKPTTRQITPMPFSTSYAVTLWDGNEHGQIDAFSMYCSIMRDGRVIPSAYHRADGDAAGKYSTVYGLGCQAAAATINAQQDSRNLWLVETREEILRSCKTPLILGVSESHVKSLFYARQSPLTESGRRRPILHWVRSHQRRLRDGIDIDISRHLRGIDGFEMDGFEFSITQPTRKKTGGSPR